MTKKDFVLIQDAINDGIETFFKGYVAPNGPSVVPSVRDWTVERVLRCSLANSLANHLKYTADAFDATTFKKAITEQKTLK